jgi:hypothetical protein
MIAPVCRRLTLVLVLACTSDRMPANDTTVAEDSLPDDSTRPPRASTWNRAAGDVFAVRSTNGTQAWLINPLYGANQALDTLTIASWNADGVRLSMLDGAQVVGVGRVTGFRYDSTCAGWPTASLVSDPAAPPSWRIAFPDGRVEGIPFDSLPVLSPADSADRARAGALAASRLPDDTITAFRGRPFTVRQASRFAIGDTIVTLFEVVRLVAQEANPLQEQLLILSEETPGRDTTGAFHEREVGVEESTGSIELLGIVRVRRTGRIALLIRRDRESGFVLEWIERTPRGAWAVRWRSAADTC